MNEEFFKLPKRKQQKIVDAGFREFAWNDFKDVSMSNIAQQAEIPEEMLTFYFENKKSLIIYLHSIAQELIKKNILNEDFSKFTDFFEVCLFSAEHKWGLMESYPDVTNFLIRTFSFPDEEVALGKEIQRHMRLMCGQLFGTYFANVNLTKFKDEVNPQLVLKMLGWICEGYFREQMAKKNPLDVEMMRDKLYALSDLLKRAMYKPEYLD